MAKFIDGTYQNMFIDLSKLTKGEVLDYMDYLDADDNLLISKGTLKSVIEAYPLDLKEIAGFDDTKVQTLKQSGGTLMWIDDEETPAEE